ncbi:MAG TPA: putative sulfate exporter family transporter [Bacteroidales bacterium]|nr:putative sulfate exporter family transporter [Bacteroidales bacterium]
MIPTVLIFSLINVRINTKNSDGGTASYDNIKIISLFPWFIVAFVGMSLINSFGFFSIGASTGLKNISKFLIVSALAAIGMNTDFNEMKKSGINPMFHGFIISALVVVVAIMVEYFMGLV